MQTINQTPYTEGVNSRMNGLRYTQNPYYLGMTSYEDMCFWEWGKGWEDADKTTDDCENGRGDES